MRAYIRGASTFVWGLPTAIGDNRTYVALLRFVWASFLLFRVGCVVGRSVRRVAGEMRDAHVLGL